MSTRAILFLGNFFFSVSVAVTIYVLLPFLGSFMSEASASLVLAAGGVVALASFPFLPTLEERYGAQSLALVLGALEMLVALALAVAPNALAGVILAVTMLALQPAISYFLDVLLEGVLIDRGHAGRLRTGFLTAWNAGVLAAPLVLAAVLDDTEVYSRIFMVAAALLVPFVVLFAVRTLPRVTRPRLTHLKESLVCVMHDRDLSAVTFAHFLLYLFFVWAPFYVPMYLHYELHFAWSQLGWMFAIMLLPYVFLEYPVGYLADKYFGDKEMMLVGFLLAGASVALLGSLSASSSPLFILLVLLSSRIGAAVVEGTTEGHFFRRVTAQDVNSISFFKGVWPLAYAIGPIVASVLLFISSFQVYFFITGSFIAIAGMIATSRINDFR